MYFAVTSTNPPLSLPLSLFLSLITVAGQQGHYFHQHQSGYRFLLLFSPHLYTAFLLPAGLHNALTQLNMFDVYILLASCATYKWKKGDRIDIKSSYLPTTARLCSEPHAIWKRSMNEWKRFSLSVWRQPQLWQEIKINLKQTTTVCRMQNQGWNDSVLKEISLYVPLGGAGTGSMLVFFW